MCPMAESVFEQHTETLTRLAAKYLWWQTAEEALQDPKRILAATMNLGSLQDCSLSLAEFGESSLASVLRNASPGWFSVKSWSLWHRVLDIVPSDEKVPLPPARQFA
jgi:hypothetical protein